MTELQGYMILEHTNSSVVKNYARLRFHDLWL